MILTQEKHDRLYDALIIGMAAPDAYIYAGLTSAEIENIAEDTEIQTLITQRSKEYEYSLLKQMGEIAKKQAKVGREQGTAWLLEKLYPRYSGKPQAEGGDIHLHFNDSDPAKLDTVEIHNGKQ